MRHFTTLVAASSILGTDALNLVKRTDGRAPRVVQYDIQRKQISSPLERIQTDYNRMRKRASGSFTVNIQNEETLYFMNVSVGTPAQPLRLHLDTGSSDLWVNVANSQLCTSRGSPCSLAGTYNANDSSSYQYVNSHFNITYVDGSGSAGDYATDTVSFGGVTLQNQQLGIGYVSSSPEGIIGIGYPVNEVAASTENGNSGRPYPNVPQNLMLNGIIGSNAYSLWLDDLEASTGSILFGGVNTAKYTGTLSTLPIILEDGVYAEFIIALTGIGANGNPGSISSNFTVPALLDSGSSLMYLPDDSAEAIYSSVGATYDESLGAATVDCDLAHSSQTIDFTFSSPTISVGMDELVILAGQQGGRNVCILGIGKAGGSTPVLGDTFIRSAYIVYDITNNEISIAQTNFNPSSDNILEITNTTGVPSATRVANAVTSLSVSGGGARDDDQPSLSSGAALPTAVVNMAALGLAGAGLLFAL